MRRTVVILIIITVISKFSGLLKDMALSYYYGATGISDAYIIAFTIPLILFTFVGEAISTTFVSVFVNLETKYGDQKAKRFMNNLIGTLLFFISIVIVISLIFTENLVQIFAFGFTGNILRLAVKLTRVSLISIYFIVIFNTFKYYLQIKGKHHIPALSVLPLNVIIIISIILSYYKGVMILGFGIVLGAFSQMLFVLPAVIKSGYTLKFDINFKDKNIRQMIILALPIILGVAVNDINAIIDKTLASKIMVGGISILSFSSKINGLIQGVFVTTVVAAIYPVITKLVNLNNYSGLKRIIEQSVNSLNLILVPSSIGIIIFSEEIIGLIYGRGAFDAYSVGLASSVLIFYSLGILGKGLREVMSRPFYSIQDMKTPVINASIGVCINIFLNFYLSKFMGLNGLALATSISALISTILMFISFTSRFGNINLMQIGFTFLKILFASLIMAVLARLSFKYLLNSIAPNLSLLLGILVGAISYFVIIYFMRIEDVDIIIKALKKKISKRFSHKD